MEFKRPFDLRLSLTNKILDWSEKQTLLRGETFQELKRVRQRQRSDAQAAYEKSAPIEGVSLELLSFRMFDLFQIQDLDQFFKNSTRLIPDLEDKLIGWGFSTEFRKYAENLWGGGWWNMGYLIRDRKGRLFGGPSREIKELPSQVDYIQVQVQKILASIFVLVLDVHLTPEATQEMNVIHRIQYLPEIRFRRLIPRGLSLGGFSKLYADMVRRREVIHWNADLRWRIEEVLQPYIFGYFMKQVPKTHLPAIDVFTISGTPNEKDKFIEWVDTRKEWWDSFGFNYPYYTIFSDDHLMFSLEEDERYRNPDMQSSFRIVVFREAYLSTLNTEMYHGDNNFAINHTIQDTILSPVLPTIALIKYLASLEKGTEQLRQVVFGTMRPGFIISFLLGKFIRVNDRLFHQAMLLDRISMELDQAKALYAKDMKEVANLKALDFVSGEPSDLSRTLSWQLNSRIELLQKNLKYLTDWYSQFIAIRNISATYLLAVIAIIVAIVSIAISLWK